MLVVTLSCLLAIAVILAVAMWIEWRGKVMELRDSVIEWQEYILAMDERLKACEVEPWPERASKVELWVNSHKVIDES